MSDIAQLLSTAVEGLGGSHRAGQAQMAQAVARAFATERHLAVQAGTGTGKSLAYLVPALAYAQQQEETVVVSTATLALQRQLVDRDLPRLKEALATALPNAPTFAIVKGRSNYVCRNRLAATPDPEEGLLSAEDAAGTSWLGAQVARVHEWAQDTATGDRDDLEPGVLDLAWRQVSVTARECLGAARCPFGEECFAELAKQKAREVDVVVTNHALLAIDALSDAEILPRHEVVVIDEAHELDGRITSVASNELSPATLTMAVKRAQKLGAKDNTQELIDAWVTTAQALPAGRWTELSAEAQGPLVGLRDGLWKVKSAIAEAPDGEEDNDPEKFAERLSLSNHLGELHDAIVRILEVFDTEDPASHQDVVWLEQSERRGSVLNVAPLSVAGLLHDRLFANNTVVLTSATLTLGGRFDAMAASWGLPNGSWDSLDAGTPFDPARAGILYNAAHLPDPGREGLSPATLDEMYELIMAAGGRTLGLFSSRRAAEQAAESMRARLPFDVLCQGEDSTGALVDVFAKNPNTCLFGTLSLWQGVDVPGPSCSLVLIDRIPFPRPDDPLLQARKEAQDAAGRNGFMSVAATHAALLMAQGAGRLLRSTTDRGVVAVLDNRLSTKRYGSFLRSSLPPFWFTTDPAVVRGSLKRLVGPRSAS